MLYCHNATNYDTSVNYGNRRFITLHIKDNFGEKSHVNEYEHFNIHRHMISLSSTIFFLAIN